MTDSSDQIERDALHTLLGEVVKEQRAARRWKIFFRLAFIAIFLILLAVLFSDGTTTTTNNHTAVVNLRGIIMDEAQASSPYINEGLDNAFKNPHSKGVVLYINSGGGSPVQSSDIYEHIMSLKKEYPDKKLYAVCSDVCASGAYYIAAAADEIYANKSSIVGSIGVKMNGFGYVDTMDKVGVTRRLITAGEDKGFLDPFAPLVPEEVSHAQHMLNIVHQQFINDVKKGRGNRLQDDPDLFSGLIWTGEEAFSLGLIDGFGDVDYVARDVIKEKDIVDYSYQGGLLQRLSHSMSSETATQIASYMGIQPQGLLAHR